MRSDSPRDAPAERANRRGSRGQTLLPREHGVYAEVGFPILSALWIGGASPGGVCFALSVVAAFLLHEPVLVLLGRRGDRVRRSLGERARRRLLVFAIIAVALGVIGILHVTTPVRIAFIALVPVTVPLAFLIATRQEKTFLGECFIAAVLSLASVPIAMAGGVTLAISLAVALVWTVVFITSTATVHAILARTKRRTHAPALLVAFMALVVVGGSVGAMMLGAPAWLLALIPAPLVCLGTIALRLPIRRLRTLGWLLVVGNLATATLLVAALAHRS